MEDSLIASLFVEELMLDFVYREQDEWIPMVGICEIDDSVTSHFHENVSEAVHTTYKVNKDLIYDCQEEMANEGLVQNAHDFGQLVLQAVPQYFPRGYTPETFIGFCAMVMGVAYVFSAELGDDRYLECAAGVVSTVLIGHMLTGDFENEQGWIGLTPVCGLFNDACAALGISGAEGKVTKDGDSRERKCRPSRN